MRKASGVLILSLLMISMFGGIVSAGAFDDFVEGAKNVGDGAVELFKPLFVGILGSYSDSSVFIGKILFLVLVFAIIMTSVSRIEFFNENVWVSWTVSITASILAVRWIGEGIITSIILPYSALGVAVSAGLPFVLYFLIVKNFIKSSTARKIAWIFFAVIFVALWIIRYGEEGSTGVGNFSFIYLITAVVSLAMLLFDKTIQHAIKKSQAERRKEIAMARHRTQIIERRRKLDQQKLDGTVTTNDYRTQDSELKKLERKYSI